MLHGDFMKQFVRKFRLSVIIPHLNCARDLDETLKSIVTHCSGDFEVVIIDGGSTDDWENVVAKYKGKINIALKSEKDSGEYDAMNKGINLAKGEYLLFLMCADTFLFGFNINEVDGPCMFPVMRKHDRRIIKLKYKFLGLPNCHQGIIFENNQMRYDLRYKLSSDYLYYLQQYKDRYLPYKKDMTLVAYDEGHSGTNYKIRDNEILQIVRDNFSPIEYILAFSWIKFKHFIKEKVI